MLRFSLSDIPVRVHFSFLIIALFGGFTRLNEVAMWLIAAFVAVLLHEAGHAFTARHYGATPVQITLFAMGGVTVYPAKEDLTPGRRFVIAAAGSTVGIVTGGLLLLAVRADLITAPNRLIEVLLQSYVFASLGWGILNWIPIRPLDGGAMMTSALEIAMPRYAITVARYVSLVIGAGLAAFLWVQFEMTFVAIFVLFITFAGFADRSDERRAELEGVDQPVERPGVLDDTGTAPERAQPDHTSDRPGWPYNDSGDEPDSSFPI